MYSDNRPNSNELPSSKQLLVSTAIALCTAIIVLVIAILPAEYGIDVSGMGKTLGLTKMGEIKTQLASESAAQSEQAQQALLVEPQQGAADVTAEVVQAVAPETETMPVQPTATREVVLAPGQAAEIKVAMRADAHVNYRWTVDSGHVNYDTHGDTAGISYHSYNKGKASTGESGDLTAAFDGKHGWYWRNRSSEKVRITLIVTGDFSSVHRVL